MFAALTLTFMLDACDYALVIIQRSTAKDNGMMRLNLLMAEDIRGGDRRHEE